MPAKPEFRIRLNGIYMPEVRVQRETPDGEMQLAVRVDIAVQNEIGFIHQGIDLGWIIVDDRPDFILEFRDETSWALLPVEMKQASVDKGWNRATPRELIGVLWTAGVLK
jgi:hypothetical protein